MGMNEVLVLQYSVRIDLVPQKGPVACSEVSVLLLQSIETGLCSDMLQ